MKPYTIEELLKPNNLQKMLNKLPEQNAFIEINNLLATKSFYELDTSDITEINKKYKIDVQKKFKEKIKDLLEKYIEYHFHQQKPNKGIDYLPTLVKILGFNQEELDTVIVRIGSEILKKQFQDVVSDRRFTDEEEAKLEELADYICLPQKTYEEISASVRGEVIQDYYSAIVDDGEISPEEYKELLEAAKSLNININFTGEAKIQIEKLQAIWEINHRELQVFEAPIKLQRNEVCYFHNQVAWYEYRAGKSTVPYQGWTGRIKFGKGLYYRYGKINYARETTQELKFIDSGDFYVTNKRVIFIGNKGNKSIPYSNLLEIRPYNNGVDLMKASGRNPFIEIKNNIEIFTAIIIRALNDY